MFSIIYFSPTGNARYAAQLTAEKLTVPEANVQALELCEATSLPAADHLMVFYAIHGFNAPKPVARFLKRLSPGQFQKISFIGVGCIAGGPNLASSIRLKKIVANKGIATVVDEHLAMPLTFITAFPHETAQKLVDDCEHAVARIADRISSGKSEKNRIPFSAKFLSRIGRVEQLAAPLFGMELHAGKKCTSCGLCWNRCPAGNIREGGKGRPKFGFKCLMCMRCIYECPEKAITPRFSKFIPIKEGYSISRFLSTHKD